MRLRKPIAFFLVLLMTFCCYAQQIRFFNIDSFEKGLNSQANPYLVKENQCSHAQDIRFNNRYGSIAKRPVMLQYGSAGSHSIHGLHRFYKSNGTTKLLSSGSTNLYVGDDDAGTFSVIHEDLTEDATFQFVTYQDNAICTNGYENMLKYDGHTQITANTDGSRTASNLCAELGAPYAEMNTGANLDASSWYQYKVAFYDGSNYTYSTARSNAIKTGSSVQDITLTDIPIGEAGTTERYVYRTLGNSSKANCLADTTYYKIATISDNSTLTLDDDMDDATAAGDAAPTWATVSAGTDITPPVCTLITLHDERLFAAGDLSNQSNLYYSDEYNPDYFDPVDYFAIRENDGDEITFIKKQLGIFTIGKTNSIQKLYTNGAESNWYVSQPSFIGCYAPYTAVNSPIGIIYLNRAGLYRFNGQQAQLISDAVSPEINDISITNSDLCYGIYHNNKYLMTYTSTESGSTYNNRVLIYDMVRDAYTIDYKDVNVFCVFESGNDFGDLHSGSSAEDGIVWTHEGEARILSKRLKSELDLGTFDDTRTTGIEDSPEIELAWDCTIDGWLTELQTKDANITTIDDIETYLPNALIDRPDTDGTWTSPVYNIKVSAFDTLYWNERLFGQGDITFQIRTGASQAACLVAAWSSTFTNATGSDISGISANNYVQLRANFSTTDITISPELYVANGYMFKLLYYAQGSTQESDFLSEYESGWLNFGVDNYRKFIQQIKVFYEGTESDLVVEYRNNEGDVLNSFTIDMSIDPAGDASDEYFGNQEQKYFVHIPPINTSSNPSPIGQHWKFNISEEGDDQWRVSRIEVQYTLQQEYPY